MSYLKLFIIFIYLLALTFLAWLFNGKSLIGIDDANIYMVYMRNFANGNGFVYNIGGEKVEGFTSLLWTLIGSFFYTFSANPEIVLLLLNLALTTFCIFTIIQLIDKGNKKISKRSTILLILIGITPGYIEWSILSLMETGLWSTLLTLAAITLIQYTSESSKTKHYIKLCIICILLTLCRPEAMLWCPVFIFLNFIKEYNFSKSIKYSIAKSILPAFLFALTLSIVIIWRLNYFGYPFPNTYYAKVSSDRLQNIIQGLGYLKGAALKKPFLLVIGILTLSELTNQFLIKKQIINIYIILSIVSLVSFIIPLYSGGDHFGHQRFLMPSIPLFFLFAIIKAPDYFTQKTIHIIFACILFFFSNQSNFLEIIRTQNTPIKIEWDIAKRSRHTSEKINSFFKNTNLPSQGVLVAGGSAYGYKGETIDLLGLNNTLMAHAKAKKTHNLLKNHASFDKNTFYLLKPDIFWYSHCQFNNTKNKNHIKTLELGQTFTSNVFGNIHLDKRFKNLYDLFAIKNLNNGITLQIFASKNFVKTLPSLYKVKTIPWK